MSINKNPEKETEKEKENESIGETEEIEKKEDQNIFLQLGDVILIQDPTNKMLNDHTFIIDYIDTHIIKLIDIHEFNTLSLKIDEQGMIRPNSIASIVLLERKEALGYARQNGLVPNTWINIYFEGDTPSIITGEITNLEEDMIEITVFPEKDVLYINFEYKGIPSDLPIQTIEIRKPPTMIEAEQEQEQELGEEGEEAEEGEEMEPLEEHGEDYGEFSEEGETTEEKQRSPYLPYETVKPQNKEYIVRANEIYFGTDMPEISQEIHVKESQQRFNVETQVNDMLNDLLSKVPEAQRTAPALNTMHIMIERFKQLRAEYSILDANGNVIQSAVKGVQWKPLANNLIQFDTPLYWVLPVVKNIKKIYGGNILQESKEEYTEGSDTSISNTTTDLLNIKAIMDSYESSDGPNEVNKYMTLMSDLNPLLTPFEDNNPESFQDIIHSVHVTHNINSILDNLDKFTSSVVGVEDILNSSYEKRKNLVISENTRQFVNQIYNTGLSRLESKKIMGDKMIVQRVHLTNTDTMDIKSIMTLPEPTIRFSKINLPGTSILDKANLNTIFLNYWQLLKQNTPVTNVTIENFDKKMDIDADTENFVNNIKNYILEKNQTVQNMTKPEAYTQYVNTIVPKTRTLFQLMKKYIHGKLSFVDLVQYLEPFLVYNSDITYILFVEMNKFIHEKISEFNKRFLERGNVMNSLKKIDIGLSASPQFHTIQNLCAKNQQLSNDIFAETYDIKNKIDKRTNSEALRDMNRINFANVFQYGVALNNVHLMLPNMVSPIMLLEERTALDKSLKIAEDKNKCITYVIAKQYESEDEMAKDNGKTIYFDKKMDDTNYGLLDNSNTAMLDKEYETAQKTKSPEEYKEFLIKKLQEKFKYSLEDAKYTADTLINGMKKVVEGNLAIIYPQEGEKMRYYKRVHNRWEEDNTVDPTIFTDSQTMLCQFQKNCVDVQKEYNTQCESYDLNKKEMSKEALKDIMREFDNKYKISRENVEQMVHAKFDYYFNIVDKIKNIYDARFFQYNNTQYTLGEKKSEIDTAEEIVLSPYASVLNLILGQTDSSKKQTDIIRFALRFTRESNATDEAEDRLFWRYCIQTNTKLLPTFLYKLASAFVENPDPYNNEKYRRVMDEILQTNGVESDDGNCWVDKYSGYVIRRIDYSTEEGYDEGYKISTRSIMEQDAGDAILNEKKAPIKYSSQELRIASNIISSMAEFMGIQIEGEREFMLKLVNTLFPSALPFKESDYKKRMEEMAKKGKIIPSYKEAYNLAILILSLSAFLIGIQVSIPSIKTRRTFPGCVRSFQGFPFDGQGDLSAVNYLSCIAYKIRSSVEPWSSLKGKKEIFISTKVKEFIEAYFLPNIDVIQRFKEKTEYLLTDQMEEFPEEHNLISWSHFLPPLVSFKIKQLSNISSEFKSSLSKALKEGSSHQREKILIVQSKVIFFSLAIQEKIQHIIHKKNMILANASNVPFLENACCNTNIKTHETTIQYFEKEDPDISEYNKIVFSLANILYDIKDIAQAPFLFSKENTKNKYLPLDIEFTEETIYRAFISFCRFQNLMPLNPDLLYICKEKPNYLNANDTIIDKIRKLKQDGKNYNNQDMLRLLQVVNRQNIVHISIEHTAYSPLQRIRDILEFINKAILHSQEPVVPVGLIDGIDGILDTYDIAVNEDTDEMRDLKNYLANTNETMKREIFEFMNLHSSASKSEKKNLKSILGNIMSWVDLESDRNTGQHISDDAIYNSIQFVKTYLHNILKDFPNIILNKINYDSIKIFPYWKLSESHVKDIQKNVKDYYSSLKKFYDKPILQNILTTVQSDAANLLLLVNETPSFTNIVYKDKVNYSVFDKRTSLLLFEQYFLHALLRYVRLSEDRSMLIIEKPNKEVIEAITVEDLEDIEMQNDMILNTGQRQGQGQGQMFAGNMKDLKVQIADLLSDFLSIMDTHKTDINLSYDKIMDIVFKTSEAEKDTFTDRLKKMTPEERDADTILKINKLGVWNKGLQKGMTSYVKEDYDQNREYMEQMGEIENSMMRRGKDISEIDDELEQRDIDDEIDREAYGMQNMSEDYMNDGEYENEDYTYGEND